MTTEAYLAICKVNDFNLFELQELTVGFVLDTAMEIVKLKNSDSDDGTNSNSSTRQATQADFDNF